MPFNPDAGRSTEEIIFYKWKHEWSEPLKARILAVAEELDCTLWDVVIECMGRYLDDLDDPIARQRITAQGEWQAAPLGKDPLLRKDGDR